MARKIPPSQARSMIRQAQQKQRQAVNKYNQAIRDFNREADKHNRGVKQAVNDYNREVRAHNSRARANRQRLQAELARLSRQTVTHRYQSYSVSVRTLESTLVRVDEKVENGALGTSGGLIVDLAEQETANSVEALNAFLQEPTATGQSGGNTLQETSVSDELASISLELNDRWRGALFALDPRNPDAARHFCASSREILTAVLEIEAPDEAVMSLLPTSQTTQLGRPTRRARIRYFLQRKGLVDEDLEDFVEHDMENVVSLFDVFNAGAHGPAGRFDLSQLLTVKRRVEDAIHFLHTLIR